MATIIGIFSSRDAADKALEALSEIDDRDFFDLTIGDDGNATITATVEDGKVDAVHAVLRRTGATVETVEAEEGSATGDGAIIPPIVPR